MTLWAGRFDESPDEALWRFTVDGSDHRLLIDDVTGSLAHVSMLHRVGLVDDTEWSDLTEGLRAILESAIEGSFEFRDTDEDVHTAVERRLGELVGTVAGKLHTGRSRNDQVCLDLRLYLRRAAGHRIHQIESFVATLIAKAEEVRDVVVPAYTHLQQAQAIPLSHHLLAYAWMLMRDVARLRDAEGRIAVSPLGAGAAGGSSLPLDPRHVAGELGFERVFTNSLDAVASRDFVAEYAFCCAQTMLHLSRLAEELILWATSEFGWAEYSDRHTTGSSALPQKKNPDIAELVRGKAAIVLGDVASLMALQKGLPLAYNRDLQEDKRAVFHADDTLRDALTALDGMIGAARLTPPRPAGWVTALDLAERLVAAGVPFREAHGAVGRLVAALLAAGRDLSTVTQDDLDRAGIEMTADEIDGADPAASVAARRTPGGGSPESVDSQIAALRRLLATGSASS